MKPRAVVTTARNCLISAKNLLVIKIPGGKEAEENIPQGIFIYEFFPEKK
jgi:hypothetical protein